MRLVIISDTHGQHDSLTLPEGDMLLHCGDFSTRGSLNEFISFFGWFKNQPFKHKVFIAGNHDGSLELDRNFALSLIKDTHVVYLENSLVELEGLKIYGSPVTPLYGNWAFMKNRGKDIRRYWQFIPQDLDILITHGPPYGILDFTARGVHAGCEDLEDIVGRVKPKLHLFGHIHEQAGQEVKGETTFINASVLDHRYQLNGLIQTFEV